MTLSAFAAQTPAALSANRCAIGYEAVVPQEQS